MAKQFSETSKGSIPKALDPKDEEILHRKSNFDRTELYSNRLAKMDQHVMPDFEVLELGEGIQNNSSDILCEFTNERLFKELKEGRF